MPITGRVIYWVIVFALVAFGSLAIFSFGAPLVVLGFTLAALSSFRNRPTIFWPWLLGVVGFIGGYLLVAPLGCTAEPTLRGLPGRVTCSSVLDLDYSGTGAYNPPLRPAFVAGLIVAFSVGLITRFALRNREFEDELSQGQPDSQK